MEDHGHTVSERDMCVYILPTLMDCQYTADTICEIESGYETANMTVPTPEKIVGLAVPPRPLLSVSSAAVKRFVKDQNIPIGILEEPYFSYYINLYEPDFKTKTAFAKFLNAVTKAGGSECFLDKYYAIRDNILESIKDKPSYQEFLAADMGKYAVTGINIPNIKDTNIYTADNHGKYFLSVDMRAANFQAMKLFDPDIIDDADTYDEFILRFTDSEYFRESKYTRQVIFGNINPKRQITIQHFYIGEVLKVFLNHGLINPEHIRVYNNDEFVVEWDSYIDQKELSRLGKIAKEATGVDVKCTSYCLNNIAADYFVKEYQDGTFTFKNVPVTVFPQVYKAYRGLQLNDMDTVFQFEGRLVRFLEPVITARDILKKGPARL